MKTKLCKYCRTEIDAKARVCPNCKRTLKGHGCLITFLSLIVIAAVSFTIMVTLDDGVQRSLSGVTDSSEYITMEEYNQIQTGMTYDEVVEIIGSNGEVSSTVSMNGITVTIYTWYGNGMAGSNANVTFTNGQVTGKAQAGLQ